jgi:hypothetical protein
VLYLLHDAERKHGIEDGVVVRSRQVCRPTPNRRHRLRFVAWIKAKRCYPGPRRLAVINHNILFGGGGGPGG